MFDDMERGDNGGGGDGKFCADRLSFQAREALSTMLVERVGRTCEIMHEGFCLCPTCAFELLLTTTALFIKDRGQLTHEAFLSGVQEAFRQAFPEQTLEGFILSDASAAEKEK